MAKRKSSRPAPQHNSTAASASPDASAHPIEESVAAGMVSQVLMGAVNGIETVTVGALQLARNVLVSAVSGAADIGAEAVSATFEGTRGVVAAASRMVGDMATTAQSTVQETVSSARQSGGRTAMRRPLARMAARSSEPSLGSDSLLERAVTRRKAAPATAGRRPRSTVAA